VSGDVSAVRIGNPGDGECWTSGGKTCCEVNGTLECSSSGPALAGFPASCSSNQIYGNAAHTGTRCGQLSAMQVIGQVEQDPSTAQENEDLGFIGVHYGSTLTGPDGTVYVPTKSGYTSLFNKGSQTWGVRALRWEGKKLRDAWAVESRWSPIDAIRPFGTTNGYESLFQPALTSATLDVPMDFGRIARFDRTSGKLVALVNPLAGTAFDGDPAAIVNSALTVGPDDNVYFTVVAWDPVGRAARKLACARDACERGHGDPVGPGHRAPRNHGDLRPVLLHLQQRVPSAGASVAALSDVSAAAVPVRQAASAGQWRARGNRLGSGRGHDGQQQRGGVRAPRGVRLRDGEPGVACDAARADR
jgi:hypothetical protein